MSDYMTKTIHLAEYREISMKAAAHDRRAALVVQWAEGLRSGKRYAVTATDRYGYTIAYREYWLEEEPAYMVHFCDQEDALNVWWPRMATLRDDAKYGLIENDPARAAAYMLAVSENWTEVAND